MVKWLIILSTLQRTCVWVLAPTPADLQSSVTPVPGNPTFSPEFCIRHLCDAHTQTQTKHSRISNKINLKKLLERAFKNLVFSSNVMF